MSEDINADYINEIFENVKKDTSLLANIDIDELLKNMEKNSYLENKTLQNLLDEKIEILNTLKISLKEKKELLDKLADYRYIQNIYELHKGKHIRWIRKNDKNTLRISNGSPVTDIIFTDNGTNIQCIGYGFKPRIFQIKWDDCIIFQKLSVHEQLILMVQDYIKNK